MTSKVRINAQAVGERIHVIPVNDLREHECDPTCWCRPTEDNEEPGLFVHHSLDGREAFETGERLLS